MISRRNSYLPPSRGAAQEWKEWKANEGSSFITDVDGFTKGFRDFTNRLVNDRSLLASWFRLKLPINTFLRCMIETNVFWNKYEEDPGGAVRMDVRALLRMDPQVIRKGARRQTVHTVHMEAFIGQDEGKMSWELSLEEGMLDARTVTSLQLHPLSVDMKFTNPRARNSKPQVTVSFLARS